MPQVSVIIPSYNHEAFIEECIESVLQQTFQDFEIIITDDGSKDGTVAKIERFTDPRIKLFRHSENKGACVAANNCMKHSQGQYLANLSSDDVWMPEKLEVQVDYLDSHNEIAAVFGKVVWIDEDSDPIVDPEFPYQHVFDVHNRSRYEWLNHFFYGGNCLCHPCSLIRRKCYDEVGWYNPTMANLPDFDLWVRICLKYDIHILDQNLIRFRRLLAEGNASGDTSANRIRTRYEYFRILDHFLQIRDVDEFCKIFPGIDSYGDITELDIPYLLGQKAISADVEIKKLWGLNLLFDQLQDEKRAKRIADKFNFSYIDFIHLVALHDVFKIGGDQDKRTVYRRTKDGFVRIQESYGEDRQQRPSSEKNETPSCETAENKPMSTCAQPIGGIIPALLSRVRAVKRRLTLKKEAQLIRESGYFDSSWYLEHNPDVKQSQIEPLRHFLLYGGFEGRDPSTKFSSKWYLDTYEDVKASGINPLIHYLLYGKNEGRKPKE
ncbi:MAG: glycosyltransferase family 2 protein [Anaerolineaceae bacterium]